MEEDEKGVVRTIIMGGGIAKQDIGETNGDVYDACTYCNAAKSTTGYTIWECPHSECILENINPDLPRTLVKYLLPCLQSGIAPAMQADGNKTYWGQNIDGDLDDEVKKATWERYQSEPWRKKQR